MMTWRWIMKKAEAHQYGFEKLNVWQDARELVCYVYTITAKFPKTETYSLVDQIRRAAISVSANLAEGTSRMTPKEQARYTSISYGSLMELLNHFYLAMDLHYMEVNTLNELKNHIFKISSQLNALRKTQVGRSKLGVEG